MYVCVCVCVCVCVHMCVYVCVCVCVVVVVVVLSVVVVGGMKGITLCANGRDCFFECVCVGKIWSRIDDCLNSH